MLAYPLTIDPVALGMFRLLDGGSTADLWEVLLACRARTAGVAVERVQLCVVAMAACLTDRGRVAKGVYHAWRSDQPMPSQWPTTREIEQVFGSWTRATAALGTSVVGDVTVTYRTAVGGAFTPEEAIACVRDYAQAKPDGRLIFTAYREWAREQMSQPHRRRLRYLRSMARINELFERWHGLLREAGLWDEYVRREQEHGRTRRCVSSAARAHDGSATGTSGADGGREGGGTTGANGEGTNGAGAGEESQRVELIATLREAWRRAATSGWLPRRVFDRWAAAQEQDAAAAGRDLRVPRAGRFASFFGSWPRALHEAGLVDAEELARREGRTRVAVSDDELVAVVTRAVRALGLDGCTPQAYADWRDAVAARGEPRPQSYCYLCRRLGGRRRAMARAAELIAAEDAADRAADGAAAADGLGTSGGGGPVLNAGDGIAANADGAAPPNTDGDVAASTDGRAAPRADPGDTTGGDGSAGDTRLPDDAKGQRAVSLLHPQRDRAAGTEKHGGGAWHHDRNQDHGEEAA